MEKRGKVMTRGKVIIRSTRILYTDDIKKKKYTDDVICEQQTLEKKITFGLTKQIH